MKKMLIVFTFMVILLTTPANVNADSDDVEGKIYSTDILAYINDKPIESYNIGGKTVIIAETLFQPGYGFGGYYNDDDRLLVVEPFFAMPYSEEAVERGTIGKIIGDVYKTDIKVLFNDIEVKGYNIGSKTAICIEDLGNLSDSPNADYGYSKYYCNFEWDESERTIKLNTYIDNINEIRGLNLTFVKYTFLDNVITPRYSIGDPFSAFESPYIYSDSFNKYKINTLYVNIDDELFEIGTSFARTRNEYDVTYFNITDIEKTKELISKVKEPPLSYDDAIDYFYSLPGYTVEERLESEEYTALTLLKDDKHGKLFAAVKKSGGFIILGDYSEHSYSSLTMRLEGNTSIISAYPFADSRGKAVTLQSHCNLDETPFE